LAEGGDEIKVRWAEEEISPRTFARSIAQQGGRNEDWIEQAVRHKYRDCEREALAKM